MYFCTIKEDDGPNDKSSKLNRENIYRISCSIDNDLYEKLFGKKPKRASKGETVILNNNLNIKFDEFLKFIDISYKRSIEKYNKKIKS